MSEKKLSVVLNNAAIFAGVTYAAGQHDLPEEAARAAESKGVGSIVGEAGEKPEFVPLSVEETLERFNNVDFSDEVLASLKFHKAEIAARFGGSPGAARSGYDPDRAIKSDGDAELPEDFPMRHVFAREGFKAVADVQGKTFDELVALDGIAEASATKALAYGK